MLFTGFMLTQSGPKVLEYNVRFGDPETEALMLLLGEKVDFAALLLVCAFSGSRDKIPFSLPYKACAEHRLDSVPVTFKDGVAVTVILAAQGYPGNYEKGNKITFGDLPSGVWSITRSCIF